MHTFKKRIPTLIGLLVAISTTAFVLFNRTDPARDLPVYGQVPAFSLTNLDGSDVTLNRLSGKVWIVDFIFTSCPGPCPLMTSKMKNIQEGFIEDDLVKFVSISIDPETDTPEMLKDYARKFSANTKQWFFLTGKRNEIVSLAGGALKVCQEWSSGGSRVQ